MRYSSTKALQEYALKHQLFILMCMLIFLIVAFPFIEERYPRYTILAELFFTVTLIISIVIVTRDKNTLLIASLIAIMAPIVMWFNIVIQSKALLMFALGLEALFFSITAVTIIKHVLAFKKVTADKIYGAISAYLLLGVIGALLYTIIDTAYPGSFNFHSSIMSALEYHINFMKTYHSYLSHFLYYSFTTITTLGYGDISPVSSLARSFSSIEAVIGKLYVAVLISRLVGLQISHNRQMDNTQDSL